MIRLYDPDVLESTQMALAIVHACSHIFQRKPYGRRLIGYCTAFGSACVHTTLPREPLRGRVTFDDVTSGEKAPLWRILCNFRLRLREPHSSTAQTVAMLLPVMRNGIFSTTTIVRKNRRNRLWMRTRSLPVLWLPETSFPVKAASGDFTSVSSSSNVALSVLIYYSRLEVQYRSTKMKS